MRRIAALLLLVVVGPGSLVRAADPLPLPTIPQIPLPVVYEEGPVVATSGGGERVLAPIRERTGMMLASGQSCNSCPADSRGTCGTSVIAGSPVKNWIGSHSLPGTNAPCGSSVCPGSPIKTWLCFRPTTGHALPLLNPAPYVGPIAGQFPCTSAAGCGTQVGCSSAAGCGTANGSGGAGPGRNGYFANNGYGGLRGGHVHALGGKADCPCNLPSDSEYRGYRFAAPEAVAVTGKTNPSGSPYSSYKPAVPPTGLASATGQPMVPKTPTVLESLKRTFSRN